MLCTTNYTIYHASCSCKYKYNLVCVWDNCTKSRVSSRRCTLERAITIDHRKKHEQHTFLLPMAVVRSQECTTSAVGGSRGVIYNTKVSTCTAESDIQLHFEWLQVQRSTCHTLLSLYLQYKYIVSGSFTTCTAKLLFHKLDIAS